MLRKKVMGPMLAYYRGFAAAYIVSLENQVDYAYKLLLTNPYTNLV
jgi:hypothetical protein